MILKAVFLVLVGVCVTSVKGMEQAYEFCEGKINGHYINPNDCRKYYECNLPSSTSSVLCSDGTAFNSDKRYCTSTSACDLTTGLLPGQESDSVRVDYKKLCAEQGEYAGFLIYLQDPLDCAMIVLCLNDESKTLSGGSNCPFNQAPKDDVCSEEAYQECIRAKENKVTTTSAPVVTTKISIKPGSFPCQIDADCHKDARCNEERFCECISPAVGNGMKCERLCTCRVDMDGLIQTFDESIIQITNQTGEIILSSETSPALNCGYKVASNFNQGSLDRTILTIGDLTFFANGGGSIQLKSGSAQKLETIRFPSKFHTIQAYQEGDFQVINWTECELIFGFSLGRMTVTGKFHALKEYGNLCGTCNDDAGKMRLLDGEDVGFSQNRDDLMVNNSIKV